MWISSMFFIKISVQTLLKFERIAFLLENNFILCSKVLICSPDFSMYGRLLMFFSCYVSCVLGLLALLEHLYLYLRFIQRISSNGREFLFCLLWFPPNQICIEWLMASWFWSYLYVQVFLLLLFASSFSTDARSLLHYCLHHMCCSYSFCFSPAVFVIFH